MFISFRGKRNGMSLNTFRKRVASHGMAEHRSVFLKKQLALNEGIWQGCEIVEAGKTAMNDQKESSLRMGWQQKKERPKLYS